MKTLKEVMKSCGVSRRAIQGYEAHHLVAFKMKNEYGHNLYDEQAEKRIQFIKQLQDFGFTLREIEQIEVLDKETLILKEKKLRKQKEELKQTIIKIHQLIESL